MDAGNRTLVWRAGLEARIYILLVFVFVSTLKYHGIVRYCLTQTFIVYVLLSIRYPCCEVFCFNFRRCWQKMLTG